MERGPNKGCMQVHFDVHIITDLVISCYGSLSFHVESSLRGSEGHRTQRGVRKPLARIMYSCDQAHMYVHGGYGADLSQLSEICI